MTLADWSKNGWLKSHWSSKEEVANLLAIVDRDLKDAKSKNLSVDWSFGIAYNAALKLCTILLHASGYKPEKNLAHYRTLQSLPLILGGKFKDDADYLDFCRKKRNETEYDFPDNINKDESAELINFAESLRSDVLTWLKKNHKNFID